MLLALVPVGKVAGREDQLRVDFGDQRAQVASTSGLPRAGVEVHTCSTRRFGIGRADYRESMVDEPAEIFDDMYLGLRAGAAERKKRRGETLSPEEQEVLGRWHRLSTWRKTLAVGAFGVGTFGSASRWAASSSAAGAGPSTPAAKCAA